jgi:hypothetical protein
LFAQEKRHQAEDMPRKFPPKGPFYFFHLSCHFSGAKVTMSAVINRIASGVKRKQNELKDRFSQGNSIK